MGCPAIGYRLFGYRGRKGAVGTPGETPNASPITFPSTVRAEATFTNRKSVGTTSIVSASSTLAPRLTPGPSKNKTGFRSVNRP